MKKHTKKGMFAVYGLEDVGGFGRALAVYLTESGCSVFEVFSKKGFNEKDRISNYHVEIK
ncbi:hypothetical protein [Paenibacillus sp. NPDC057934]|uniref:hypothetical protein n=1 Tax=Paenibacillus sp. NPDC057934 TaxID=3346282 RepID=UPI0036DF8574